MDIKKLIYDTLWQEFGAHRQSLVEDLVKPGAERELPAFIQNDEPTDSDRRRVLTQAAEISQRELVHRYVRGIYGEAVQPGQGLAIEQSYTTTVGQLDDQLIDLALVPSSDYMANTIGLAAVIPAAAKAAALGISEVKLVVMDQNSQDWAWFKMAGNFEEALDHVKRTSAAAHEGKPFPMFKGKLDVQPDISMNNISDRYLWSLNQKESHRKVGVIHPSAIAVSRCDRALGYCLAGEKPVENVSPKLRRIFDVGHVYHEIVQLALGWALPHFHPEVSGKYKPLKIDGSCDGVINGEPREGIEIKTINDAGYKKLTKAKPEHTAQGNIYGIMLELEALHYIYVNKNDGDLKVYRTPVDRSQWHETATKATNIIKLSEKKELSPRLQGKDYVCRECSYNWICKPELNPNKQRMFSR